MNAMYPDTPAYPMPSTAGVPPGDAVLRDVWPCASSSIVLDESCGLLDPICGLPKHLFAEPSAEPTNTMHLATGGEMALDVTTYPTAPWIGAARLRDDPIGMVLPHARPDTMAEALADAIYGGNDEEVRRLVASNADPNAPALQGRHADVNPLALAVRGTRSIDIIRLLLESGAEVCCTASVPGFNSTMQAWTTTFVDFKEHDAEMRAKLRLLLEFRADVNARIPHTGDTALHWAASDFQRRRSEGASAKINRWTTKRTDCAKMKFLLLLQARADPLVRNRRNLTPLDLVSVNFQSELPSQDIACQELL